MYTISDIDTFNVHYLDDMPRGLAAFIKHGTIFIKKGLPQKEERCYLEEEIQHYYYTAGNIVKQEKISDVKQEILARRKAHLVLIPFNLLIECYDLGLRTYYEVANYLNVTEKFLYEAVEHFKQKYGLMYYDKNTDCYFDFGSTIQIYKEEKILFLYDNGC
ncbi:ImmA/IrrE family metallo-endopeptidase [Listeria aquatica]|uniref:ImmA/IrrE family metallo-endopeptidase n=1 Tax=Listeria aquatica TaxID=1494960 RepID=UPI003EF2BEFF